MTSIPDRLSAALADRYRIERELGQGGMATVFLAEDLKHRRNVALKVLKPELAAVLGAERFVQEITTTASLQHPHILPLFDSGTADGFLFYVMPFIEGETLRDRLNRETQLGVDEAVKIAIEVADALEYAHGRGVIHRDIKPENILLANGRPMVADFGIALAVSAAAGGRMTETGLSLGTPHYMSPEQATAEKEITGRSDVYSLASVLYEMLAGVPPHEGGSAQQTIMRIIADTPRPLTELRKSVPPHVAAAVAKAQEKLPADRFESAARFAEALANPAFSGLMSGAGASTVGGRERVMTRLAVPTAIIMLAIGGVAGWMARPMLDPTVPAVMRFTVAVPQGLRLANDLGPNLAISPDGRTLAYFANDVLYKRALDRDEPDRLGTARSTCCPTFSKDGRWIMFGDFAGQLRQAISVDGGPPVDINSRVRDEDLVFSAYDAGVRLRPAGDTAWSYLTRVDSTGREASHTWPQLLPDGRHVLYTVLGPGMMWTDASVVVQDIVTGERITVAEHATSGRYVNSGHIVYATAEGALEAMPFDVRRQQVTGDPVVMVRGMRVAYWGGAADFAIADNGTLAYVQGSTWDIHRLTWLDRNGTKVGEVGEPATYEVMSLSPDGRYVVSYVASSNADISRTDLVTGERRRLTFDETTEDNPVWSPDGKRFAYRKMISGTDHRIYSQEVDGQVDSVPIFVARSYVVPRSWSPDGRTLAAVMDRSSLLLVTPGRTAVDTVTTQSGPEGGQFSPDGRWFAYVSTETGAEEVYVVSFPGLGGKQQVSTRGGKYPHWSARSGELFFVSGDTMMVSRVTTGATFTHSVPRPLFVSSPEAAIRDFVVTADGQRFLYAAPNPDAAARQVHMVLNWTEELKARVAKR